MSTDSRKSLIAYSLFHGIEDGRISYVEVLLQDEDADPNYILHDRGIAPIHMAIGHESKPFALEVTKVLLQYGANPNLCSAEGMTPVHIASLWGRTRLLRLLLLNGGNPWLEDEEGKNAFHFAFEENHSGAMQVLEDFRLKDNRKFDEWTELCDPNPKFTIALDKVLLYNREVLLSYQASIPFASRGRCSAATQTSPLATPSPPTAIPAPPPEASSPPSIERPPPPRAGPVAASTTALADQYKFVLSDIRNKVVSQVTLRKVANRTPLRRTTMSSPPGPLTFLDELRQRQSAGLRHVASQMSPPARLETRVVRDEVMVRVTPSPAPSGDESHGSDEFESHLDRAFRHLEVDAAIIGEAEQSSNEWLEISTEEPSPGIEGVISVNEEARHSSDETADLQLDLRRLHGPEEMHSDVVNVENQDDNMVLPSENHVNSNEENDGTSHEDRYVTMNGFDSNTSQQSSAVHDNIPYGKYDSSFGICNTSFGTNYVTANASNHNTSAGTNIGTLNAMNNETHGITANDVHELNESRGAKRTLFSVGDTVSRVKRAWFGAFEEVPGDNPEQCVSPNLYESSQMPEVDTSCDMYAGTSYDIDAPATEPDAPLERIAMPAPTSPEEASFLMVTARSQISTNAINASSNCAIEEDPEPCETESVSKVCEPQVAVSQEDGCSVVWEGAMDASESFCSCRDPVAPTANCAIDYDEQQLEDVVTHSFASLPEEVSKEFISEDEECFDSEPLSDRNGIATVDCDNVESSAGIDKGQENQAVVPTKATADRTSWSSESFVSASEEYVYKDEEEKVVLVERRFLVPPSDWSDESTDQSLPAELDGYDTDNLRSELRKHGVEPGPILPSTKRVYIKKLQRAARGKKDLDHKQTYSCELDRSLREETWCTELVQYEALEKEMSAPFAIADPRKCWREGVLKSSFCYLLLDPRITANLPCRASTTPPAEAWATFLEAVFYVGKGKRSRPYSHLYQAVGIWNSGGRASDAKTQQILDIWSAGLGVVCLHVFQNVIPVEAYTREAAMLDALTLGRVRNARRSEYYGVAAGWPAKRRNMLGTLLLHKALRIFLGEGERQLRPGDIRH